MTWSNRAAVVVGSVDGLSALKGRVYMSRSLVSVVISPAACYHHRRCRSHCILACLVVFKSEDVCLSKIVCRH